MNRSLSPCLPAILLIIIAWPGYTQTGVKPKVSLDHTAIFVTDLKASADFYKNVIGLDPIPEPFHDGKHAWFAIGPGTALHIYRGFERG